jgi:hypothetical protein
LCNFGSGRDIFDTWNTNNGGYLDIFAQVKYDRNINYLESLKRVLERGYDEETNVNIMSKPYIMDVLGTQDELRAWSL